MADEPKDIQYATSLNDVVTESATSYVLTPFRWLEDAAEEEEESESSEDTVVEYNRKKYLESLPSSYDYAEIDVPFEENWNTYLNNGCYVNIPARATEKPVMIGVRSVDSDGNFVAFQAVGVYTKGMVGENLGFWCQVYAYDDNNEKYTPLACELPNITTGDFYLQFTEEGILLMPAEQDFAMIEANEQNVQILFKMVPGNCYRYLTSGVGLIRWINGSGFTSKGLPQKLKEEMNKEGIIVNQASFDYSTEQLNLDLSFTNVAQEDKDITEEDL